MKKNHIVGGLAVLVILAVAAWNLGWFAHSKYSNDPAVAELQQLRDQQFASRAQMDDADQQSARDDFRERMQGLSEDQRRKFFESGAPFFMKMMEQRIDRFLALTPEEQRDEMDKRIDEMQKQGGPPGGGGFGGEPPKPEQIDQMRKRMLDGSTPDQRAKFERAMTTFQERMKERGVNPGPGGGFF